MEILKFYISKLPKYLIFFSLLLLIIKSNGADDTVQGTDDAQQWIHYNIRSGLSPHWSIVAEGGLHYSDRYSEFASYVLKGVLVYNPHKVLGLSLGYIQSGSYEFDKRNQTELRPFQELEYKPNTINLKTAHRFRLEERILKPTIYNTTDFEDSFNLRFRYKFSLNFPLFKLSRANSDRNVSFNIEDELFVHTGKEIGSEIFDQNWLMIGPTVQLNKNLSMVLIYNYKLSPTDNYDGLEQNTILWLKVKHKLNFSKNNNLARHN